MLPQYRALGTYCSVAAVQDHYLVALLCLRCVLWNVLIASLVVHDELVFHKVKAVRLCFERVCNHFLNLARVRSYENSKKWARSREGLRWGEAEVTDARTAMCTVRLILTVFHT